MSLLSTDPIADMLTRIRNAISAGHSEISLPHSNIKETVAKELMNAGYLSKVTKTDGKPRPTLNITINEPGTNAVITAIERVSKPGRRVYAGATEIPKVKSGRGIVIVSTSRGVMTGQKAVRERLGGELICKVY
jgi:small subunit ribosomal protein S8